jgi:glutamine synthetase
MANLRFSVLEQAQNRQRVSVTAPSEKISDYFGVNVLDNEKLRVVLSSQAFKQLQKCINDGEKISSTLADIVASAMKNWAISRGVTHYTHWFQPLRGTTAEKHDSFFQKSFDNSPSLEQFKGAQLIQQEPDASSFPSGGLRNTFEARGYSAWDPTSPAFIFEVDNVKTLCIPSLFVSYKGEALDYKTPLLKSLALLNKAALPVCRYFDRNIDKVTATIGAEQEFFLVDKALFNARPDLLLVGKTVLGHSPARGQQLDDHYFGAIPSRVKLFMKDFEIESLKLGIPLMTRHNEVAPGQYECAPIFEDANLSTDHNLLMMDVMRILANKHNFEVIFHEKPFAGINGSGKHNNWSLSTNTGVNLLSPSSKAKANLQFLVFFVNTIKAVHDYADLMRASIASAGNDYRLGANEAPPAIFSVFIGTQLSAVLDEIENNSTIQLGKGDNMYIKLGIDKIPSILMDNTDRNRTSPFAFTGNKFEFRAVGSTANNSSPITVLNTIMANQLNEFRKEVDAASENGSKKELVIIDVLRKYIKASKAVRFEQDGYADDWVKEAKKRGLSNLKTTPEALEVYLRPKMKDIFIKNNIFTDSEILARQEILVENYIMQVQIESRVLGDLAQNHVIPIAIKYQNELIKNVQGLQSLGLKDKNDMRLKTLEKISKHINTIISEVKNMILARKKANELASQKAAYAYCNEVKPHFEVIRRACDKLELLIDDELWTLPKYREMLFIR